VLRSCKLDEEFKWKKPCYSTEGKNIAIIQPMKEHVALMFFKGAILDDPKGILQPVGPNSRNGKRVLFTNVSQVNEHKPALAALVAEAVRAEKEGVSIGSPEKLELVPELTSRLESDAKLRSAFFALTPGRQRGYNLHFSGAKQSATRTSRIEKCAKKILAGKGLRD
jgi:uncharacterized protein YdeI (YjbR/CyaY-like superfamily)